VGITLVGSDEGKTRKSVPPRSTAALHRIAVAGDRMIVVGEKGTAFQANLTTLK
jgi:hypothetical protein